MLVTDGFNDMSPVMCAAGGDSSTFGLPDDVPLSPAFIEFIARWVDRAEYEGEWWFDQVSEGIARRNSDTRDKAEFRLQRLLANESAQESFSDVEQIFSALCGGDNAALRDIHDRYQFLVIIGIPRNGGSYLTGECFSALGHDPRRVPASIAHDGFPDARPFSIGRGTNPWLATLLQTSEYLAMVKRFFVQTPESPVCVPKKLTKAIYAGRFFRSVFGSRAQYVVTVRHPIACCISTYEQAGGLPADGLFCARSVVERWAKRDLVLTGTAAEAVDSMDYFGVYVGYWERFHIRLALSGIADPALSLIVPFGKEFMEGAAMDFHRRCGSNRRASEFVANRNLYEKHPEWITRANEAIERVGAVWSLIGLKFPRHELQRCS